MPRRRALPRWRSLRLGKPEPRVFALFGLRRRSSASLSDRHLRDYVLKICNKKFKLPNRASVRCQVI